MSDTNRANRAKFALYLAHALKVSNVAPKDAVEVMLGLVGVIGETFKVEGLEVVVLDVAPDEAPPVAPVIFKI